VAFGAPANGKLTCGPAGTMVYTPNKWFSGTDQFQVTTTDAVKLYAVDTPPLATVGGVDIQSSANGSAIAAVPGKTDEIYGMTDRGPDVDGRTDTEKVLPIPDFHPQIAGFQLTDGTATPGKTIILKGPDGEQLVGLVDPQADTGESLVTIDGQPLPPSDHGLDTEGLVALPDGTFWVSDEYGPFLVHFDAAGKELERLSPFDGTLPRELSLRSPNQGMEGLTITPDGTTLVGIMQSALKTPGLEGSAKSVPFTRIVTVDLATKAVSEYLYPLANPQQTKVAVSEITALTNTTFLVDERDGKLAPGANKKIYVADIAGATDVGPKASVAGATYVADAGGLQVGGKALETVIGVTTDTEAVAALKAKGITTVTKTLKLDLGGLLNRAQRQGRLLRPRQGGGPRHTGRRKHADDRQRQRLRSGRPCVGDAAVQLEAQDARQRRAGQRRVPRGRHHQAASQDPDDDAVDPGGVLTEAPKRAGPAPTSVFPNAQTNSSFRYELGAGARWWRPS